ncbi:DUF488 domain-containing protein [Planomonospora parontospora]|uniref:DUF488 domain-containing protein n=1 Tax=Planomonospora parontospora TaxID=58119 RepID=UPI0016707174|nr:DUF488 domain-containing protein [Planomonospora parontospora]
MTSADPPLLTFGHGTADRSRILEALHGAGARLLIDVRRFPGSRRHPHVTRDALARWLPADGIAYRWEPRLGGRRRVVPTEASPDSWWRVEAFRAYAAHCRSQEFGEAMTALLDEVRAARPGVTVVMCSETLWWRCHRRLISDVAVLVHGLPVEHLGHDGRRTPHPPSAGARLTASGLVYDRRR